MRGATRPWLLLLAVVLLGALSSSPLEAQQATTVGTPVTALGLGYPVPPLDARAMALGGTGIGLFGGTLSFRNPADISAFKNPAIGITVAPEQVDVKTTLGTSGTGRNRFTTIRGVLPLGNWTIAGGFRSETNQDWGVFIQDTLQTTFGESAYIERQEESGGLSSFDVSGAYDLGPVVVGGGVGLITGSLIQEFVRNFEAEVGFLGLGIVLDGTEWNYQGWRFQAGATTDFSERVRFGAVFGFGTHIHGENDSTRVTGTQDYTMPVEVALGGSAWLTAQLLLSVNGGWVQWSRMKDDVTNAVTASTFSAGGGLEYTGISVGSAVIPLRAGYRWTELPFFPRGAQQLTESAFTAGLGIAVSGGRGRFDMSVDFGGRGDLATTFAEESFTRWWFSFQLAP